MNNWTGKHTLIVGLALILLTNAVALLGVYWNRSGVPESTLTLTQRELQQPYDWGMNRENSGMSLRIHWRVHTGENYWPGSYSGGQPLWLDQAKMASLGFDVTATAGKHDDFRWSSRQLGKEVLLVLEQDGPAWQQALQSAQQYAEEQDAKLAAFPIDEQMKENTKRAHEVTTMEAQENSRLFAIDAGLNLTELRVLYPDRNRYAIVRAQVRPSYVRDDPSKIAGYIDRISIDEVNVPYEYHTAFEEKVRQIPRQSSTRHVFEAGVAFGQRLEPWLIGISVEKK